MLQFQVELKLGHMLWSSKSFAMGLTYVTDLPQKVAEPG